MDDLGLRIALLGGALFVAGLAAVAMRRRDALPVRLVNPVSLDDGVYLFSSGTCSTCARAREDLDRMLGPSRFTELTWGSDATVFHSAGVDAVPAVLVVVDGKGRLYPGPPGRRVRRAVNP